MKYLLYYLPTILLIFISCKTSKIATNTDSSANITSIFQNPDVAQYLNSITTDELKKTFVYRGFRRNAG